MASPGHPRRHHGSFAVPAVAPSADVVSIDRVSLGDPIANDRVLLRIGRQQSASAAVQ